MTQPVSALPTPPMPQTSGGILWTGILTVGAALLALWRLLEGARARELGRLEASNAALAKQLEDEREAHRATQERLGLRLDEERIARLDDARRTARVLLQAHDGRERPPQWDEAPTGVRDLLELVSPSRRDPRRDSPPPSLPPPRRPPRPLKA